MVPEPPYDYETDGYRSFTLFPSATILEDDDTVRIYYGAADTVVALATAKLESSRSKNGRLWCYTTDNPERFARLGERFGGRITFMCPVDIQNTMVNGTLDEIRAYCRKMIERLGRSNGGFIPCWYADPDGAGHRPEAVEAMCEEFLRLGRLR